MKKFVAIALISLLLAVNVFSLLSVYGGSNIVDIYINEVKVKLNGENTDLPNLLYDGKTYVALREISNLLGVKVDWDSKTNTVILDTPDIESTVAKKDAFNIIIFSISKSLLISGLILIAQIVFARTKKDFYFIKKFNSSNTGLKRLILTNAVTRIGLYYLSIGIILGLFTENVYTPSWVKFILIPLTVVILWLLGLMAANSISKREVLELVESNSSSTFS